MNSHRYKLYTYTACTRFSSITKVYYMYSYLFCVFALRVITCSSVLRTGFNLNTSCESQAHIRRARPFISCQLRHRDRVIDDLKLLWLLETLCDAVDMNNLHQVLTGFLLSQIVERTPIPVRILHEFLDRCCILLTNFVVHEKTYISLVVTRIDCKKQNTTESRE